MIEFRLPSLGADMDEGTLLEWKIRPGDVVSKGQVVALVDTSKSAVDVECWSEGRVAQIVVQVGQKVPVGTVLALLLEPGEIAGVPPPEAVPARQVVSPAARKRARELGIDVATLRGSGPGGAITLADVERAATDSAASTIIPADTAPAEKTEKTEKAEKGDKAAEMRRAIAAAMSRSKREIPHYYLSETIPLGRALAWLQAANAQRAMSERVLPAALLLKAVARALARYPEFNGSYHDGAFDAAPAVNVGVAISLRQGGLIAPALFDCAHKPLAQLMRELADLVQRTRAGSLKSSELSDASVTVTNLGDQGCDTVFGVIYPPQVALIGFGRIKERPWVDAGALGVQPTVTASLAADHRVSDGHRGARLLVEISELLQQPAALDDASPDGDPKT